MNFSKSIKWFVKNWFYVVIGGLIFLQILVFGISGESSYIAIHDNLDLFVSHFKMLKDGNTFFSQEATLPMLSQISRDAFASEFSLYNILYAIFPVFVAYMIGYALKIIIGFIGMNMLFMELYGRTQYETYRPIAWLVGFGFGLIPVFPAYGIAFTSIPLVIILIKKIAKESKWWHYILLFCYPLLSYFSYFGFFILGYMVIGFFILWIIQKKINTSYFIAIPILASGYVVFEYRLFRQMLFSSEVTIRETMVNADSTLFEVCKSIINVLKESIFHAQDSHKYLILPVCIIFLVVVNGKKAILKIKKRREEKGKSLSSKIVVEQKNGEKREDLKNVRFFNWTMAFILFNGIIYGLYEFLPFRNLFEFLLPPMKGFQFNRTLYFNPFLWYLAFFFVLKYLYDRTSKKWRVSANILAIACVFIVMFVPQVYNDFYSTCYNKAYQIIKQKESSTLNFEEFYSVELFDMMKEDMDYTSENAVAYGIHPAVLHYNG
ncbi:MAG: DUF6044 family protein, partial [Eubacteriales bacterium]